MQMPEENGWEGGWGEGEKSKLTQNTDPKGQK